MSRVAARLIKLLALAALTLAVTVSSGSAASPARTPILGVVPHTGLLTPAPHRLLSTAGRAAGPPALTFDASYENLINRYFTDVAHDSGDTQNVYSVATQYYDIPSPGPLQVPIQYQSAFGGSYVDRDPLPQSGCNDGVDSHCLTDRQLRNEIQRVLTARGWHGGLDHVFFVMTPSGVGSCVNRFQCSTTANGFCAYHGFFTDSNGESVIYADEPYEGPLSGCADPTQGFPNNLHADTTINTISHELNESITDPLGHGWYSDDANQDEEADLCAYGFGAQTGTPGVDAYNQVINGDHYDLQEEYSNAEAGCVQRLGGPSSQPPLGDGSGPLVFHGGPVMHTNTTYAIYWLPTAGKVPTVTRAPRISGRARVGEKLSGSHGSWSHSPTYRYQWLRCNAHGGSCSSIHRATQSTYKLTTHDAGHRLRLRVTATNAAGSKRATSSATARVPTKR
jgi:phosphate-induced protein 1